MNDHSKGAVVCEFGVYGIFVAGDGKMTDDKSCMFSLVV